MIMIFALLVGLLFHPFLEVHAQTDLPVVHAVLFYSPTCGHCEYVMNETLVPMIENYGGQLQIVAVDVTQPYGQELFLSALQVFGLEQSGVPFLVIDDMYLVGSMDIPEKFPGLVESYLAQGGLDWPEIPGLRDALNTAQTAHASTPTPSPAAGTSNPMPSTSLISDSSAQAGQAIGLPAETKTGVWERVMLDPLGNGLSILVLLSMIVIVLRTVLSFRNHSKGSSSNTPQILVPILCVIGFGVAGYLSFVETTQTTAVCGPVGDCNTVQQSEYARLFGFLPIGVLGSIGYVAILIAWLISQNTQGRPSDFATISLFVMTFFGTLFSIYLTYLEPFVIGATCAWCLTSAVLMTALMLLSRETAKAAITRGPFTALHR
jgi:uncharacterized membrane protein